MRARTLRFARILAAGASGAARWLLLLVVVLVVGLPALRSAVQWYVRGTPDPLPVAAPATVDPTRATILDASAQEAGAIRQVLAELRFGIPPADVTFAVTDQPRCAQCEGDYSFAFDRIEIDRAVVDSSGPTLRLAVAHEIGHYVDAHFLGPPQRASFMALRGIPANLSWESPDLPWARRPIEDFAEVFATLAVPSAVFAPDTAYGPVRDPAAIVALLKSVGVDLGRALPATDVRQILHLEVEFGQDLLSQPALAWSLFVTVLFYVLYGAWDPMVAEWRREGDGPAGRSETPSAGTPAHRR